VINKLTNEVDMPFELDDHTGILIKKAARLFEQVANSNLDTLGVTYCQTIFLVRLWAKDGQTRMSGKPIFHLKNFRIFSIQK